ncbi:hypothetical protein FB451DRAFT_1086944 [Mycena latifolia]|nr:hypothetical protein FB451DRAFT_1086944 [Mycena latifolia]
MATTAALHNLSPQATDPQQADFIRELIRSHRQLPPQQLSSIVASLSDELARYDANIANLQDQLTRLISERAALKAQYDACRTVLAPIRRLPAEILGEIFALTSAATFEGYDTDESGSYEMDRLAQTPLRTLSQVCARWHTIVMGTSSFWGKIHLDGLFWVTPALTGVAMRLLQAALDRGRDFPLTVVIINTTLLPAHPPALELLAQHSERWQTVHLACPFADLQHLSGVRGKLPRLETLEIAVPGTESEPVVLFDDAPGLRNIAISGDIAKVAVPSPEQLHSIGYRVLASTDIAIIVSSMSSLSQAHAFQIEFFLDDWTGDRSHNIQLDIAATSSDISRLSIELLGQFHRRHCQQALSQIFTGLTLPHLQTLEFTSSEYPRFPFEWPHASFLALAERSAFRTHLHVLSLYDVYITDTQLLQCLAALPALERLEISDHHRVAGRGTNYVLISDTLLRALAWTPEPACLIPRLNDLRICSRLEFDGSIYLALVLSRVAHGRTAQRPFKCEIVPHAQGHRALDAAIHARLRQLQAQKELFFTLSTPQ